MIRQTCLAFLVLLQSLPLALATEETNRKIAAEVASVRMSQRRFQDAQKTLSRHLAEDAADAGAWDLLGLVQLELNDLEGAAKSFSKAYKVAEGEQRGVILYHLAAAYDRNRNREQAERALKLATRFASTKELGEGTLSTGVFEPLSPVSTFVSSKATLGEKGPADEKPRTRYAVSTAVGYDSNIGLIADNLPDDTSSGNLATPFAVVVGQASQRRSSGENTRRVLADIQVLGLASDPYRKQGVTSFRLEGEYGRMQEQSRKGFYHREGASIMGAFAQDDGFAQRALMAEANGEAGYAGSASQTEVFFRGVGRREFYPEYSGSSMNPTAYMVELGPGVRWRLDRHQVSLQVGAGEDFAEGEAYRHRFLRIPLLLEGAVTDRLSYACRYQFRTLGFIAPKPMTWQNETIAGLVVAYRISEPATIGLQLERTRSDSDTASFIYSRTVSALMVSYAF
jgi:tetratricopeptide (TPR) repeat protein